MREEEDPGSPAMLLEDLDQAWMVTSFSSFIIIQFTYWRGATDQSILPNISGYFETVHFISYLSSLERLS